MAEQSFTHKKLGVTLTLRYGADDLRQRDIEKYAAAFRTLGNALGDSVPEYHGKVLRAAITAGWVMEPALKLDEVPDLHPKVVAYYAMQVDAIYRLATSVPKDLP